MFSAFQRPVNGNTKFATELAEQIASHASVLKKGLLDTEKEDFSSGQASHSVDVVDNTATDTRIAVFVLAEKEVSIDVHGRTSL